MLSRLLLICSLVLFSIRQSPGPEQEAQREASVPNLLKITLSEPPRWTGDCLNVSLDLINASSQSLFLPDLGLYIYTSVKRVADNRDNRDRAGWINVYGASDIGSSEAKEFAPGATLHDEHCLFSKVAIVSLERKTRRLIVVRGKLRIDALYFPTKEEWLLNKSSHEEMLRTPPNQWNKIARYEPNDVTIFTTIPCREPACDCGNPPPILEGEARVVPDVFYLEPDWETRGKVVSDRLAHRFPRCSSSRAPRE